MKNIVFDTSFILSCIKEKIDFLRELEGYHLLLPKQVIKELENIKEDKRKNLVERSLAKIALDFLEQFKNKFEIIELEKKFVDRGLELFLQKKCERKENNEEVILATLDKELRKKLKGKIKFLIITRKKKLEFVN